MNHKGTYHNSNPTAEKRAFSFLKDADFQHGYSCANSVVFTGKEKDSETGYYYFGARYYDSDLSGLFLSVDPMSDKYPNISPYAYCEYNPIRIIDPSGDSCAVLLARDAVSGFGHMAILVQNKDMEWQLWSKNGDDDGTYKRSSGNTMGTADDAPGMDSKIGKIATFKTVQEFLGSSYNTENHDGIGGFYYTEAYILPTTPNQDRKIEKGMQKKLDEKYNVIFNNCSQAVVYSLNYAGVEMTSSHVYNPNNPAAQRTVSVGEATIPVSVYEKIQTIHPGNLTLYSPISQKQ